MRRLSPAPVLPSRPTLTEAERMPPPQDARVLRDSQLLWGPIDQQVSKLAGMWSPQPTASILLRPQIPSAVRDAVLAEVPVDVLPTPTDTVQSLVHRLSESAFLEDIHVLKGGRGPRRIRLNATPYPQPRRRSTSVEVEPEHVDDNGDRIATRLCYTAYGRLPSDWAAEPMSRAEFNLGYWCWLASYPILTPVSQACPPTGMQLLVYYRLFDGRMNAALPRALPVRRSLSAMSTRACCDDVRLSGLKPRRTRDSISVCARRAPPTACRNDSAQTTTLSRRSLFTLYVLPELSGKPPSIFVARCQYR